MIVFSEWINLMVQSINYANLEKKLVEYNGKYAQLKYVTSIYFFIEIIPV